MLVQQRLRKTASQDRQALAAQTPGPSAGQGQRLAGAERSERNNLNASVAEGPTPQMNAMTATRSLHEVAEHACQWQVRQKTQSRRKFQNRSAGQTPTGAQKRLVGTTQRTKGGE